MPNMYLDPRMTNPEMTEEASQEEFEHFYEDVFVELERCGDIEELNICENVCDHLAGNVYVKWKRDEDAGKAMKLLTGRFYAGLFLFLY
jgi:splicing factor U2AF subunit